MTRRPPSILGAFWTSDGGLEVRWEVDQFFTDSAEPEKVLIDLNGAPFEELDGDETSVEVPANTVAAFGAAAIAITVSFWWADSPPEEQRSVVVVPAQTGAGTGNAGVLPAMKPIVTLLHVQPATAGTRASIKIGWESNNYNDGTIIWGPESAPRSYNRSIRPPNDSVRSGVFTTDQPLSAGTRYVFRVEVRNTLHSPTWLSTTVVVRSAIERPAVAPTVSVRQFLQASGRPVTSGLASLAGPTRSLRQMLRLS
jgi:hypothetical protein